MKQSANLTSSARERGMSLVVALIMLLMMTVTALMLFRMSNTGTQIVGNMQFRNEALASADAAIQEVLSTTRMFETPNLLFLQDCGGSFNRRCFDLNGDQQDDVQVDVAPPSCVQVDIIPNASLNLSRPNEADCAVGVAQTFGMEGAVAGNSLCANTLWEVRATASDAGASQATGARMTVVQGVGVQVKTGVAVAFCAGTSAP
ncbi:hypothetical protein AAG565_12925 [Fontimonas sp. SYSU GA230001]|uniref:pilus assembly PilX family protein n=1 Tax=Fontimonas sp. SYSU GA230001 TaxID=3142450 RepID=UPI0032B5AA4A